LLTESGDVIGYHVGGGKREGDRERERKRSLCLFFASVDTVEMQR
jgi:hypothetical protein